ncbi:MAG: hypothetical protein OEW50_09090, partial [Gammaproteobacteria bacterium]|nr:hypothetical protein [Gammaproteobacteria bacterium]
MREAAGDAFFPAALFLLAAVLLATAFLPAAFLTARLPAVFAFASGLPTVLRFGATFVLAARFVAAGFVLRTAATGSISDNRRFQSSAA